MGLSITYLGHAGFQVETEKCLILMDPWFTQGMFDYSWYQFPSNANIEEATRNYFNLSTKVKYIYISHEHLDHYDSRFLNTLVGFTYIIPDYENAYWDLQGIKFKHKQLEQLEDCTIQIFVTEDGIDRDSAILVRADKSFLNCNDCKITDMMHEIGTVDYFTMQYAGASWYPVCYPEAKDTELRIKQKINEVKEACDIVKPTYYIPSAGPPCFKDPELLRLNSNPMFPRPHTIADLGYQNMILLPGDTLPYSTYDSTDTYDHQVDLTELDFLKKAPSEGTQELLIKQLEEKLSLFELHSELFTPLYYCLEENSFIKVDFQKKKVSIVPTQTKLHYTIKAPAWSIRRVLDGHLTWVQWSASFRASITRNPDKFNELLLGFIVSEVRDIEQLCKKTKQLRSSERMTVQYENKTYEVNRYCPHQWADLKDAPIKDGKLICPRHRWEFDLLSDGDCKNGNCSIKAIEKK